MLEAIHHAAVASTPAATMPAIAIAIHFRCATPEPYVVQHDGYVVSREVVVVSRPFEPEGDVVSLARDLAASTFGLLAFSAQTALALTQAVRRTVIGGLLDRLVPPLVDAIVSRVDLTEIVISRVDLRTVVETTLDRLDLTEIVVQRVDIDRIVAEASIDDVIDRVPMIQIADYIIEEIDLPQIIRESTGGIAMDAFTSTRFSAARTDEIISRVVDSVLLRRKNRDLDAPSPVPPAGSEADS